MRVGIIMPCKASAAYTKEAVESILTQTHRDFTFLIIDDDAPAETKKYLQTIKDPRVNIITHTESRHAAACLNEGLRALDTEYVFEMHADDVSHPQRIEEQLKYWSAHPQLDVLGTRMKILSEDGDLRGSQTKVPCSSQDIAYRLAWSSAINHPTVGLRRAAILKAGGYREDMVTCEDYELWTRLAPTVHLGNSPKRLLYYRLHEGQNSKKIAEHKTVARKLQLQYRARLTGLTEAQCDETIAEKDWDTRALFYERMAKRFPSSKIQRDLSRRLFNELRAAGNRDRKMEKLVLALHPLYAWSHGVL